MRWKIPHFVLFLIIAIVTGISAPPTNAGVLVDVGGNIRDIAADPVRNEVYVSIDTGEIVRVNLATESVTGRLATGGDPDELAVSPDGTKLFVGMSDSLDVLVVTIPGFSVDSLIDLPNSYDRPWAFAASNTRLFAACHFDGLSIVDTATGVVLYDDNNASRWAYVTDLRLTSDFEKLVVAEAGSPPDLRAYDVSNDDQILTNIECCHTCPFGFPYNGTTVSGDDSEVFLANGNSITAVALDDTGIFYKIRRIPLSSGFASVKGVVLSEDGAHLYAATEGEPRLYRIRTSDWFPYHYDTLDGDVTRDGLVLPGDGSKIAAVTGPQQVEIVTLTTSPTNNTGGIVFRAIDNIENQPVADLDVIWGSSQWSDGLIDVPQGIWAWGMIEPGVYDFEIRSDNHETVVLPNTTVGAGSWTDLGDIILTRSAGGIYPMTNDSCTSPAAIIGRTTSVSIHGTGFLPGAIVEVIRPDLVVDSYELIDWSRIDVTITETSTGWTQYTGQAMRITNISSGVSGSFAHLLRFEEEDTTLTLETPSALTAESYGQISLIVNRSGSLFGDVTVDFETVDDTATAGNDYTTTTGTFTWLDGNSDSKTITVPILQDAIPEGPESFTVELSNPTGGAVLGTIDTTEVTIEDDDSSTVRFTVATTGALETGGTASLTVRRTGDITAAGSVIWATADGTAVAGEDYISDGGTLDWAAGNGDDKTINITILNDSLFEDPESFTAELSSPGGNAFLGEPSTATVNIADDDVIEIVFSAASFAADEGDGNATITAWRTGATNGAVTADFATTGGTATAGSDYTDVSGTLSWADGDIAPKTFDVPLLEDGNGENDETVLLALSAPTGGATIGAPGTATLTIEDNDGTSLQFTTASFNVGEWQGDVIITVERVGGDTSGIATIDYATSNGTAVAGEDYVATSGTLSWADGNTDDKTFSVMILDDGVLEGSESLTVTLTNPTGNATLGSPVAATIAITDDEWVEQLINTETDQPQTRPDVAMATDGRSVVVWESYLQDGSGWGIFGQRFDAAGNPAGAEFQVNATAAGDQRYPAAAMRPDGSFTVVWLDSDGAGDGIRGRRFNAAGAPVGSDFTVNLTTAGDQTEPDVAVDGSGAGIVVWQSDATGDLEIRGRRLDATGVPTGSELTINSTTAADQQAPAIAGAAGGGFVIVWQGYGQDGPADGIIARLFTATGAPTGAEVVANEWTAGNQISPAVGRAADGSFLVAWEDTTNKDGSGSSIRTRWFSAGGTPLGGDVQANTYWLDDQTNPTVACSGPGNALIAWESENQDGSNLGIYTQALGHDGVPSGIEQRMNTFVIGIQYRPAVADSASGAFWATWASGAQDGSGDGVYGLFSAAPVITVVFADGFDSGDTSAWGATTP